jgi:hypothetical protein
MWLIRLIFTALVLGALGWSGWWFALAQGQERALAAWFEGRARHGWQAERGEIRLTGFPLRLAREVTDIRLADPEAGWAWAAPWLRIESGAVEPTRFAVTWPARQSFAVPGEVAGIGAAKLAARLELRPEAALGLVEAAVEAAALEVEARSGWRAAAAAVDARVGARVNDTGYDLSLDAGRVVLPEPLVARVDPLGFAGREIERLVVEGAAVFTRPLDRRLIEEGRLGLVEATVRRAALEWGEVRLEMAGSIRVDGEGYPVGALDVTARHWRELVAMAQRTGAIGAEMAQAVVGALELVAMLGGDRDRLSATLRFADGRVWIGPVSVGRAPRLAAPGG